MIRGNPSVLFFIFGLLITSLVGCGSDDGPIGATASLSWDPGHEYQNVGGKPRQYMSDIISNGLGKPLVFWEGGIASPVHYI